MSDELDEKSGLRIALNRWIVEIVRATEIANNVSPCNALQPISATHAEMLGTALARIKLASSEALETYERWVK